LENPSLNYLAEFKKYATFALLFFKATDRIKSHEKNVPAFTKEKKK